jgi:thiaminase (transcriptional activator TenA)
MWGRVTDSHWKHVRRTTYDLPFLFFPGSNKQPTFCSFLFKLPSFYPKHHFKLSTMSQRFWDANKELISITEKHPFLISMVHGTLEEEKFKYYVIQDALYLTDYSACLRLLGDLCPDENDSKRLYEFAVGAEETEKALHKSFFQKWNIHSEGVEQMPHSLLYTSYLLRIVSTRPFAEGLAAVLPCFWVYMHVGKCLLKLREDLGDSVTRAEPFDEWIDLYASEEFEKEVLDYKAIVDKAVETADDETLTLMQEHFTMCCKLEHMFWDQANDLMTWPSSLEVGK